MWDSTLFLLLHYLLRYVHLCDKIDNKQKKKLSVRHWKWMVRYFSFLSLIIKLDCFLHHLAKWTFGAKKLVQMVIKYKEMCFVVDSSILAIQEKNEPPLWNRTPFTSVWHLLILCYPFPPINLPWYESTSHLHY